MGVCLNGGDLLPLCFVDLKFLQAVTKVFAQQWINCHPVHLLRIIYLFNILLMSLICRVEDCRGYL